MKIENTNDRDKVKAIRKWSIQLVNEGKAEVVENWDTRSPWHNSKFIERETKRQWVIYQSDHAWPGEVKLISTDSRTT
jgi:hypothetical protein